MPLKTVKEYLNSLRAMKFEVYFRGERIENPVDHPVIRPSVNAVAMTYALAHNSKYKDLATAYSPFVDKYVNRFTHIHQSTDDLLKKVELLRTIGQLTGVCFQRCVGMDGLNAVYAVTYEIDEKYGTQYHQRFINYLKYVQENDLVVDGAMTDPKGDRGLRPSEQEDKDLYLRVVKETEEGIVVRGAKFHQTGAINSHEILVMPTISLKGEEEKPYAVSFAVPSDSPGIVYVYGRQPSDLRSLYDAPEDCGNPKFAGQEAVVIFNDVFVPWERVFMCGEVEFAGNLVEYFASYHRQSYGGCKVGVGDVLIGAAANIAEFNGVDKASHIKDKIVEMIHLNETIFSCGVACSCLGYKTSAGNYMVDRLLANVCKQNVTRMPYEIARLLQDIAGGLFVTMPSWKDLENGKVGELLQKYLVGKKGVKVKDRVKLMRLIENLTLGRSAVGYLPESMHGAGSPQAQRIMITRLADIEKKKKFALRLAGIGEQENERLE
ncbi:4-hydroxyphenylacetate 3-hydroxylase family protein [Carboxydothermus hydrogenoformans]|uniref:Gamma-aminobutyrate metabolism dehydratase/isomerase n=1 Tax=Carboxydothermus hydrogenoformans (strain ATCC BAA-161 / DSM 6008 / Z-2901) TaxID=246194 RepID=Q3ACI6_CARHZ|nr:4-hydroxyphenylacetate 3-hydroxylase family protein [Carboxydothermus hydrogenoformans]ABB14647.1 gamma-aminobutyrate metabolism dehydratase/isomerase [Carboxydothermus hydrogenoformans Z-2901]